jgi:hypothetical protein
VPISALLDEREKRQNLEQRAEQLERDLAALASPPKPLTAGEEQAEIRRGDNLRISRKFAERAYTPEVINQVHAWAFARCAADPHFNARMMASEDPYEDAKRAFDDEQILAEVKPDQLAQFRAWQQAQADAAAVNAAAAPAAQSASPPRSLAAAPGNGGAGKPHVVVGEGQAFASAFPR